MKAVDLSDVMVALGLVMIAGGLAAYDWRVALVVCGALLLAIGLAIIRRQARDR